MRCSKEPQSHAQAQSLLQRFSAPNPHATLSPHGNSCTQITSTTLPEGKLPRRNDSIKGGSRVPRARLWSTTAQGSPSPPRALHLAMPATTCPYSHPPRGNRCTITVTQCKAGARHAHWAISMRLPKPISKPLVTLPRSTVDGVCCVLKGLCPCTGISCHQRPVEVVWQWPSTTKQASPPLDMHVS